MTSIFKAFFLHFFLLTKWQKWVTRTFLFFFSAAGIDCFKCVSVNGSNPACEDPFHNNHSSNILERPCMGGRKGRNGLFPASACIKLSGTYCKNFDFIFVVVACFQILKSIFQMVFRSFCLRALLDGAYYCLHFPFSCRRTDFSYCRNQWLFPWKMVPLMTLFFVRHYPKLL